MAADGHGTTITFGTSGFSAACTSISQSGVERGSLETTHLGTSTAKTYTPAELYDPGTIEVDFQFAGDDALLVGLEAELITIDWGGDGSTWATTGFVTGQGPSATSGEIMTQSVTIKLAGTIALA